MNLVFSCLMVWVAKSEKRAVYADSARSWKGMAPGQGISRARRICSPDAMTKRSGEEAAQRQISEPKARCGGVFQNDFRYGRCCANTTV